MSKAKFKTGDLVENIHTGEVEMLEDKSHVFNGWWYCVNSFTTLEIKHYCLISPKSVKFNLKIK
jgi:hypothetical protein